MYQHVTKMSKIVPSVHGCKTRNVPRTVKRNLPRVALALPVGQEQNASGDEVVMRHLRIRQFHVQNVVNQDTTRELVLKEQETTCRIRQPTRDEKSTSGITESVL
jgi:hypothetical protein